MRQSYTRQANHFSFTSPRHDHYFFKKINKFINKIRIIIVAWDEMGKWRPML